MAFNAYQPLMGTPQQGLGFAGDPVKKPFDINNLLGNPLLHAGIGLLGSQGRNAPQMALQGAMQGAQYKSMLDKQAQEKAAQERLQATLGEARSAYQGGDPMVAALLGTPETFESGISLLGQQARTQAAGVAPSNVREWEAFSALSPEDQKRYLLMKRAGPTPLATSQGFVAPSIIDPSQTTPVAGVGGEQALPVAADVDLAAEKAAAQQQAKAEAEREFNQPKALAKLNAAKQSASNVLDAIANAKAGTGALTTGLLGAATRGIAGTPAFDLAKTVETVKANLGFDRLQQMRDNSPTGGALGQVAVQELNALQATVANLDTAQSTDQMLAGLDKVERHYQNYLAALEQSYQDQYGSQPSTPVQVNSQAEYDALPSGAIYIEDGKQYRKP